MEFPYRCIRATRLGVEPRIVIPNVASADAPVALRCSQPQNTQVTFDVRWHAGRLWRPRGPHAVDHLISGLRSAARDDTRAQLVKRMQNLTKTHIAIDGDVHVLSPEPYWLLDQIRFGAPRDVDALVLIWASPKRQSIDLSINQEGFRADRLAEAKACADAKFGPGRYAVLDSCEVLMPEVLQLDPEADWWAKQMQSLVKDIEGAADRLPKQDAGRVAEAIGGRMRDGIERLAAKNGWSRHAVMRLYAALTRPTLPEPS